MEIANFPFPFVINDAVSIEAETIKRMTCTRDEPLSKLARDVDYTDWGPVIFFSPSRWIPG
jgi:hypothetical protein